MNGTEWLKSVPGLKGTARQAMTSAPVQVTEPTTAKPEVKQAKPAKPPTQTHRAPTPRSAKTLAIESRLAVSLKLYHDMTEQVATLKRDWLKSRAEDLTPEDAATARSMALSHAQAIADAWDAHYQTLTRLDREYHVSLSKIGC